MAKRNLSSYRKTCLASFQKLRRLECSVNGYCKCISCGKVGHYKEMDGGHYIPRAVRALELEPDNVWPQCKRCNAFLEGNTTEYRKWLIKKIGLERVEWLEDANHKWQTTGLSTEKRDIDFYRQKKREYDAKIKELEWN